MSADPRRTVVALVITAAAAVPAGCTAGGGGPIDTTSTHVRTVISTRPATPDPVTYTPPAPKSAAPLPPGRPPHHGEVERRCPYIKTGLNQDAPGGVNVADIEGDRIYRTTVLTRHHPVGCRFYFYAPPYEAVADIVPRRFATATDAHNALVLTARTGSHAIGAPDFVPGVDGISYQTRFFGQDGDKDWAFAFAKGRTLVIVRTQQSDTSHDALYLGRALVGRF